MRYLMISMVAIAGITYIIIMIYFPHPMLNPGDLTRVHAEMDDDCFACHTAFRGIPADKCVKCHPVDQIGLFKANGNPVDSTKKRPVFHGQLLIQDCMACHSDHLGRTYFASSFSHDLISVSLKEQCLQCHAKPNDRVHIRIPDSCVLCHETTGWKPARFDHSALNSADLNNCVLCHEMPEDALHKTFPVTCDDCHTSKAWKPATFDHDRYFTFDKDHRTECATCHTAQSYQKYTCYGCHEHTPSKIREEHMEEGIRDYENCVRCHRSGDKHQQNDMDRQDD